MKIETSAKNFDLTPSLREYIEEKASALSRHLQKFEMEGELQTKVRIGRITGHHHKGDVYEASIDISLPQAHLRADNVNEDVRTAIDQARDIMVSEIEKYKTKHS